jgi:hypothetical protein
MTARNLGCFGATHSVCEVTPEEAASWPGAVAVDATIATMAKGFCAGGSGGQGQD